MRPNNFDVNVPVTMCHEVEAQANNCENKASLWTDFKNSFAWLTGMKKLIFQYCNFFGFDHFLIHEILKKWPKNDRSQKIQNTKKSVASCPSTTRRNLWILFMLWPNFYDWFLKLWAVISRWRNIFSKNFLAQIIIYGWYFGWFKVEQNPKILDDL